MITVIHRTGLPVIMSVIQRKPVEVNIPVCVRPVDLPMSWPIKVNLPVPETPCELIDS
jgi:hypothetical protein